MKNNNLAKGLTKDGLIESVVTESAGSRPRPSIFDKVVEYERVKEMRDADVYPYFKALESSQEPEVRCGGCDMIMLSSNNYLGLTSHPKVVEAAIKATREYGTGCAGSRFMNGTLEIHEELEARLAKFFSKEAAIVFPTGFQANLGAIAALVGKGDVVIIDRLNHACIYDGCRLSYGQTRKFNHNDMEDLHRVLKEHQGRKMLIVVDGVFSMEGDIAPLPEITQLADEFGAAVMVDDAHGIGVLGKYGAGSAQHFGVEDKVDIIMGTYSKSMATIGGCLAGDAETMDYLKHNARPLIFSASLPAANTASALAALDIIENEPERRERLWSNADHLRNGLIDLGFNTLNTQSTVVPVYVGDDMRALQFWRKLFDGGLFVTPVIHPGVAKDAAIIRTSVMASHKPEHLDKALDIFASVGREFGLINNS